MSFDLVIRVTARASTQSHSGLFLPHRFVVAPAAHPPPPARPPSPSQPSIHRRPPSTAPPDLALVLTAAPALFLDEHPTEEDALVVAAAAAMELHGLLPGRRGRGSRRRNGDGGHGGRPGGRLLEVLPLATASPRCYHLPDLLFLTPPACSSPLGTCPPPCNASKLCAFFYHVEGNRA
jgi:hypothetical protein